MTLEFQTIIRHREAYIDFVYFESVRAGMLIVGLPAHIFLSTTILGRLSKHTAGCKNGNDEPSQLANV